MAGWTSSMLLHLVHSSLFSQIAIIVKIVKVNEETFNHILYFSQRGGCLGVGVEVWPDL